jgi:hypothetical protein
MSGLIPAVHPEVVGEAGQSGGGGGTFRAITQKHPHAPRGPKRCRRSSTAKSESYQQHREAPGWYAVIRCHRFGSSETKMMHKGVNNDSFDR